MESKNSVYFRNQLHDVIKVSAIYTIHYFRYGKNFRYPMESHNFWELVFIDNGEATIHVEDKTFTLRQGEVCFHKPNIGHTISTSDNFANSVIISFEASGRMMNFFENKTFVLTQNEKDVLASLVLEGKNSYSGRLDDADQTKMVKRVDAPFGGEQLIKNSIELLLISIVRNNFQNKSIKHTDNTSVSVHAEQIVEKIIEILNSRVTTSVDLESISKELYFSKTYIKAVFKKYTGTSIIKYYNKLKIDEAKRLISLKEHTLTEITYMLGFKSVHYFSRLFKMVTDMTPSEYAKSIKVDNVLQ